MGRYSNFTFLTCGLPRPDFRRPVVSWGMKVPPFHVAMFEIHLA